MARPVAAAQGRRVTPRVFINSAGYRLHDYAWHEVTPDGDAAWANPRGDRLPAALPHEADRLVSLETETHVLVRTQSGLVALIAALASEVRTDFMSRRIEDCLLVCAEPDEEPLVRHIMAEALDHRTELIRVLDQAITIEPASGFAIDWPRLAPLLQCPTLGIDPPGPAPRTMRYTQRAKDETAAELRSRRLPRRDGLLLMASPTVSRAALTRAHVWRGLWGREDPTGELASPVRAQRLSDVHAADALLYGGAEQAPRGGLAAGAPDERHCPHHVVGDLRCVRALFRRDH
jgi:hypothetical protein